MNNPRLDLRLAHEIAPPTDPPFTRGASYPAILAASERVAWTVDEVFGDRRFDASRPMVPGSWVGTGKVTFLDAEEQRVLNHCRAFSYVHLLGNFEEFAPVHLTEVVQQEPHDARERLRALLRFADEEMKHQQLFLRAERVLEESCGHAFGRYFDAGKITVTELTRAILDHGPLPRFLMVLALEWGTQRHYVESIRAQEKSDPLYVDILRAHWIEEAQHTKSDVLEIARLAGAMSARELEAAFDDVVALGGLVDAAFAGQAEQEIETLEQVTGRTLSDGEFTLLRKTLYESLGRILAGIGLTHPTFAQVALELSPKGAAKLGLGA